jgi:predicted dithiol-disulfide oxidoreductase (DUF899 family)
MKLPPVVSADEWEAARAGLLAKEKELTRAHDGLAAERRQLPMVRIEKDLCLHRSGRKGEPRRPVRGLAPADRLYRTYFTIGRGVEALGSVWTFLELTPLGRQEDWEDLPQGYPAKTPRYSWCRRHDDYGG